MCLEFAEDKNFAPKQDESECPMTQSILEDAFLGNFLILGKTSETPVKSILYGNSLFPCKECFWEENQLKNHFWEIQTDFGKCQPFWGIAKYQEVLLCAGKVTKEDVKRKAQAKDTDTNTKYEFNRNKGRVKFPKEVRKLIYNTAKGRCVLCGRKITYDKMTLDHIVPLAMNGEDDVRNLQCTCESCNLFKGSVLPEDFMDRINEIFWYQMEKKNHRNLLWILVKKSVKKLIFGQLKQRKN